MTSPVLLRFAPSPTGPLHLGGLRTALVNHIHARKLGGKWLLRIEDTDAARAVPGSVEGIREGLAWAGLDYDYGPGKAGPHGPYFQSQRLDLYHFYAKKLLDTGHAYRCFCTADELQSTRERLARSGLNQTYDKKCLNLTEEEVARRVKAGEKSIVRLNDSMPPRRTSPPDLIFGHLRDAHASLPTDPVLLKSDLFPTYHLASVVDDHEMGITHVLRGEEWLPSVPLHLDLYASFNFEPPQFAHLPILLNPDGSKMSKRKGDVRVVDFIERGWEPQAVVNWLALAGWGVHDHSHSHSHSSEASSSNSDSDSSSASSSKQTAAPDSTTVMSLPEIIQHFDLSAVTHRRSVLDPTKLEYLNKHHLMRDFSSEEGLQAFAERMQPDIKAAYPDSDSTSIPYLKKVILALQGRLMTAPDLLTTAPYFFQPPSYTSPESQALVTAIPSHEIYLQALQPTLERLRAIPSQEWEAYDVASVLHEENKKTGLKSKVYMTVMRHALSGMKSGPSVPEIMKVLGQEKTLARLEDAASRVGEWYPEES
ncbi:glutamyl-tRNA synthetase [Stereum hirsutum FP-91666 SS1]|uniref:glutamyl-tRNA synthetase n=1 Tax=Stereum hirsutum (strain FP-91666) TaxID=721885 RepID=UPI000440BCA3|nr:glutamyl-tRNA synthetase [Stereum hirsutum FP-91666 SS1]EIM92053.1 glutamyl-tRNA synthetase [Stereum hirsutum FP-91666 SS1]